MSLGWRGAVAVVTGASRGIGRAVALAAAGRGAAIGLLARSSDDLEAVAAQVRATGSAGATGGRVTAVPVDVTDRAAVGAALARVADELGPVDILVNNAGIGAYGSVLDSEPETYERLMDVNYLGTVWPTLAVLPAMAARRRGHIVNVASIAGRIGAPFEAAYSASKFAVVGFSEALAVEVAPLGIGVSLVNPGPVDTAFFETRGSPYAMKSPRPIAATEVARAVIEAVERNRREQVLPRTLAPAPALKALVPPLYRVGVARTFRHLLEGGAGPAR